MAVMQGRVDIQIRTEGVGNAAPKVAAVAKQVDAVQKSAAAAAAPIEGLSRKVQSMKAGLDPLEKLKSGFDSIVGSLGFVGMAAGAAVGLIAAVANAFDDTEKKAAAARARVDAMQRSYENLAASADRSARAVRGISAPGADITSEGALRRAEAANVRARGGSANEFKALELEQLAEEADRRDRILDLSRQKVEIDGELRAIAQAITDAEAAGTKAAETRDQAQREIFNSVGMEQEARAALVKFQQDAITKAEEEARKQGEIVRTMREKEQVLKASLGPMETFIGLLKGYDQSLKGTVTPAMEAFAKRSVEERKKDKDRPKGGGGPSPFERAVRWEVELAKEAEKDQQAFLNWRRQQSADRTKRFVEQLERDRREEAEARLESRRREDARERRMMAIADEEGLAERGVRAGELGAGALGARDSRAEGIAQFARQLGESLPQMGAFTAALGSMASAWNDVTAANENAIRIEGEYREGRATETQLLEAMADARKAEGQAAINSVGFLAKAGAESIKNERMRAGVLAVIETGLGLGKVALGDYVGAAGHFAAATTLGSVAIFGSAKSSSGDQRAERSRQQLSQQQQSQQQSVTQVNVYGGWYGGSSAQENAWALQQQSRRHAGNGFARAA